jgi:hybrid cluster-associated redox disulfide protein
MKSIKIDSVVDEIMTTFPRTIAVFLRHRMSCVGCLMGSFHTVADAAEELRTRGRRRHGSAAA